MGDMGRRDVMRAAASVVGGLGASQVTTVAAASSLFPVASGGSIGRIWEEFCAEVAAAAQVLSRPMAPKGALDQVEGVRYLSRLTRGALEMAVESSDPDFPRFYQLSNEILKIGADNPDNLYAQANIAGDRVYRVTGSKGSVPYLSMGTKANRYATNGTMASTGEIDGKDLIYNDDGSFEIYISKARNGAKNWLPSSDDTTLLLIRQTFLDRNTEVAAQFHIEAVGDKKYPVPLTEENLSRALKQAAAFVNGTSKNFAEWTEMFMSRPNELLSWDQSFFQRAGGDPNIYYLHGYWNLQPNQAWILRTPIPACRMWNFQVDNWWMESLDYRTRPNVWTNSKRAKIGADGALTLVVSPKDLGFGTWIDTAGHSNGTALLRWIDAETHPEPRCEIVSIV
jgi:hypothetical protein